VDPGEAIYRHITGGKQSRTEIRTFGDAVKFLVRRYGSASNAARAAGVPPSSFRHWASGKRKPTSERAGDILDMALLAQRRGRLSKKRERELRAPLDGFKMVGRLTYDSAPEPDRELGLDPYLADDLGDQLVDAYLDGATPDELAAILSDALSDAPFYQDTLDPYSDDGHLAWDVDSIEGWGE
jgi:hypothetical protein